MIFIIDLMVISNVYFVKLCDFIMLCFLFGFFVKIEIFFFYVFNVCIIFSNLCGCDEFLSLVWVLVFSFVVVVLGNFFLCEVDFIVFEVFEGYSVLGMECSEFF